MRSSTFNALLILPFLTQALPSPNSPYVEVEQRDILGSLSTFLNDSSSALQAILDDHGTVIFQNDILKNGNGTAGSCPKMTVLFARGTVEPGWSFLPKSKDLLLQGSKHAGIRKELTRSTKGNVGILTGPPMFAAIGEYMNGTNQLAIQGVDYPADTAGFLAGGSVIGGAMMAALINSTLATCPNTPLVVSGYSQGAQVVHLATASLPANTTSKIASVVLFGDPKNGTALQGVDGSKVLTICDAGDDICQGGDRIGVAHLSYSRNATEAAMFVLGSAGATLGITSQNVRMQAVGLGATATGTVGKGASFFSSVRRMVFG